MKVLFIYSKHSEDDRKIMETAKQDMPTYIEFVELNQASQELRNLIRATPAIIPIVDDMQGEYIKGNGVDGKLIAVVAMNKWLEKEEKIIHNQKTERLDNFITHKKTEAIDNYTEELITGGGI